MSNYPRSLQYFLNRLSGWTSNQVRLNVAGSTSAAASSMIEVSLPANTLCDLRSLAMQFDATFNSATAADTFVPRYFPNVMIRRAEWSVNGITLSQSSNSYGLVYNTLAEATCPPDFQQFNMLNSGAKPSYSNPVAQLDHALSPKPTYTTTGFLGFGSQEVWMNTSLVGSLRLRISLETNDILGQSAGTDSTFNLDNIHFTITCGSLNDGLYNAALQEKLARQEVLQLPFKAYSVFEQGNTNGGVCSIKATLSSSSVDRLYGLTRANNYRAKTCSTQALFGGTTPFYTCCAGGHYMAVAANQPRQGLDATYNTADLTHYQFQVNSVMCPNYLVSCGSAWTGAAGAEVAPAVRHGGLAALECKRSVGSLNDVDSGDGLLFCMYAQYPYNTNGNNGPPNVAGSGGGGTATAQGGGNAGAAAMAGQNMMQHIYKNYHCITSFALEYVGASSRTLSGLNMRGSVGSIYFNATYSAGDSSNQVLIVETTQILAIGQNGSVELIV